MNLNSLYSSNKHRHIRFLSEANTRQFFVYKDIAFYRKSVHGMRLMYTLGYLGFFDSKR